MQIILVSRHLPRARTLNIMPRHVVGAVFAFLVLLLAAAAALSWLSIQWRLPLVEELLLVLQNEERSRFRKDLDNSLQAMATRLGELQARQWQLDSQSERIVSLSGMDVKRLPTPNRPPQGGPYLPVAMSMSELQAEIDRLATRVELRSDDLAFVEFNLLEQRVRQRVLPTALPVKEGALGSHFGHREDPISGGKAMHEGIDFSAEPGTSVLAAADGMVLVAEYHPEYGNLIELDHGDGLTSRYAHLSAMAAKVGERVRREQPIGAVGNTGRSTGAHLHFEVRMLGVAQNPAQFLRRNDAFAQLKRR